MLPVATTHAPNGAEALAFTVQATRGDLLRAVMQMARGSRFAIAIGTAMLTMGIVAAFTLGLDLSTVFLLAFGVSLLTGLFAIPFQLWAISRRPDLTLGPVSVSMDEQGITVGNADVRSEQAWKLFRKRHELREAFFLQTGVGGMMIPKRGLTAAQLDAVRRLLGGPSALTPLMTQGEIVTWSAVGFVLGLLPIALGMATAR
jgi:hypothetical protein